MKRYNLLYARLITSNDGSPDYYEFFVCAFIFFYSLYGFNIKGYSFDL
jgi:hypothetical protein